MKKRINTLPFEFEHNQKPQGKGAWSFTFEYQGVETTPLLSFYTQYQDACNHARRYYRERIKEYREGRINLLA